MPDHHYTKRHFLGVGLRCAYYYAALNLRAEMLSMFLNKLRSHSANAYTDILAGV